jgi:hypothetical protein
MGTWVASRLWRWGRHDPLREARPSAEALGWGRQPWPRRLVRLIAK